MTQPDLPEGRIELRLRAVAQVFNSLDPSPFHDRDLDDTAEEYILDWARELPPRAPIRIIVHLPADEAAKARTQDLGAACRNYFCARADILARDRTELFRTGRQYLAIGIPLLVVCLLASQFARAKLGSGPLAAIVSESLVIVGWVANWKPIETFLYDWWPLKRRRDLYLRLADAEIEIVE